MSRSKLIHLAADLSHYHTDYLWKMPGSWEGYPYYCSPEFYEDIARTAARGIMDMLFFGDSGGTPEDYGGNHHAAVRYGTKWPRHDMMPMIPCMSRVAEGVGFGITMSTTYHHPFPHRAGIQRARSRHQRPHRLERSHLALEERGGELRLQKNDRARRALRARAGAPAGLPPFVGQHRTGRHQARPRKRNFRRSRQSASPQFRGRVLQRARSPARVAVTAAASGHHSGRTIRTGHGSRRALRRPAVFHAADAAEHEGASRRTRRAGSPNSAASREDCGILWSVRIQVAGSEAEAQAMEEHYLDSIPPEAGLIELSSMYGLDFSRFRRDMRLSTSPRKSKRRTCIGAASRKY